MIVVFLYPLIFLLVGSLMTKYELTDNLKPLFEGYEGNSYIEWTILPQYPTLKSYIELLLDTPEFFVAFWNSFKIVILVVFGQLIISIPIAWGLSYYEFKLKKIILIIYINLAIIPFMVYMFPQYILFDHIGMIDSLSSIVVPGIFSTTSVVICYMFFLRIPKSVIEASKIDSSDFKIFIYMGLPLGRQGIVSSLLLCFIEYWTMIEQPLVFIKNPKLTMLTLYIPEISLANIRITFVSGIVTLIPVLLILFIGQKSIEIGLSSIIIEEI